MSVLNQKTIKKSIHIEGVGLNRGKKVKLDDDTFERIYKKQMVLDLCLFVYNLNLFEKIHRPYTYITYNLGAFDNKTKDAEDSTLFSVASSRSNRDNIEAIRKEQNKEGIDTDNLNNRPFVPDDVNDPLTQEKKTFAGTRLHIFFATLSALTYFLQC